MKSVEESLNKCISNNLLSLFVEMSVCVEWINSYYPACANAKWIIAKIIRTDRTRLSGDLSNLVLIFTLQ